MEEQEISSAVYHGCFNSFLMVDGRHRTTKWLRHFCRGAAKQFRHLHVDGFIIAVKHRTLDVRMVYLNADGSPAKLCLNGVRCLAAFAFDTGIVRTRRFKIATDAGTVSVELLKRKANGETIVRCKLPFLRVSKPRELDIGRREFQAVTVGVPHAVTFVKHHRFDWARIGAEVEKMKSLFPEGTNVNFVRRLSPHRIEVRTWERGSGKVLACGSGACASAIVSQLSRLTKPGEVTVKMPGGELTVHWRPGAQNLVVTGPAVRVPAL